MPLAKTEPWRSCRRWKNVRKYYMQENPLCEHCKAAGKITVATDCDHEVRVSHGGSKYDHSNLNALCQECHWKKTALEKKIDAGYEPCDEDGYPL